MGLSSTLKDADGVHVAQVPDECVRGGVEISITYLIHVVPSLGVGLAHGQVPDKLDAAGGATDAAHCFEEGLPEVPLRFYGVLDATGDVVHGLVEVL